jgi:hypothetical protein
MTMTHITRYATAAILCARLLSAQSANTAHGYPVPPRPLPEAEEIALATSAAPNEISSRADVYVLRGTDFVKVKSGTNGCACILGRDLHDGSRYPICFDREGARTSLFREIKEGSLRAQGKSEDEVVRTVAAAYASGALQRPSKPSIAYMMSPNQVLFSSPGAEGVRVGAWSPHVMLLMQDITPEQFGLAEDSKIDVVSMHHEGEHGAELVVKVPKWSDGRPVVTTPH